MYPHSGLLAAAVLLLLPACQAVGSGPAGPAAPPVLPSERVPLSDLVASLGSLATRLEGEPAYQAAFSALRESHGLAPAAYPDFVRVRMVFEATRDGGLWGVRWSVTNREPQSDAIWAQWQAWDGPDPGQGDPFLDQPSATAECDEISALAAFLSRKMGVTRVGLLWPTSNHTVAAWTAETADGGTIRVLLPTSQVFLGPGETLGTRSFDANAQRVVYDYGREDVPDSFSLPSSLATAFLASLERQAGSSPEELQARRNDRSARHGGS